jgi:HIV Tat-specific factor 1
MAELKEKAARRQAAEAQKQGWFDLKVNTSVYITGLPTDITFEEMKEAFGKCGLMKLGDDGQPRIKLYK